MKKVRDDKLFQIENYTHSKVIRNPRYYFEDNFHLPTSLNEL